MQNILLKLSPLIFYSFFTMTTAFGQNLGGGDGDGQDKSGVVQSTLKGLQLNNIPLYGGGDGDGSDKSFHSATLSGTSIAALFMGGQGDGFDKDQFAGVMDGTSLIGLFSGGNGDGFDKENFNGVMDGTSLAGLFAGGIGDGFDKEDFNGVMDGTSLAGLFGGGDGDGFDKAFISALLSGTGLAILYGGGTGDGFDKDFFNGVMNGTDLAVLFGGGDGDGFDKALYQGILAIPLPVELIVFDAYPEHRHVVVFWITATEIDNDYFTIQRTKNFDRIESIGDIPTLGNLNGEQEYDFIDPDPYMGTSYYRLKITGLDGESGFSEWVDVKFEEASDFQSVTIYPNPVSSETVNMRIDGLEPEMKVSVRITSMDGRIIYQKENLDLSGNSDVFELKLSNDLAAGLYVVTVYGDYQKSLLLMKAK